MAIRCYKCDRCSPPCYKVLTDDSNINICIFNGGNAEFDLIDNMEMIKIIEDD